MDTDSDTTRRTAADLETAQRRHGPDVDAPPRRSPESGAARRIDAFTAARRVLVFAILRTLAREHLARLLVSMTAWLHALDAAYRAVRRDPSAETLRAAEHIARGAASDLMGEELEGDEALSYLAADNHRTALAAVWFQANPYDCARRLDAFDRRGDIAEALGDLDAARAELLTVEGEGASPPSKGCGASTLEGSTSPRGCCLASMPCDVCRVEALRELLRDAARLLGSIGSTSGEPAQLAASIARFMAGEGDGRTLVFLAVSLATIGAEQLVSVEGSHAPSVDAFAHGLAACELSARCAAMLRALLPGLPSGLDAPSNDGRALDVNALDVSTLNVWPAA